MFSERTRKPLLAGLAACLLLCASCTEFLAPSKTDFADAEALNEQLFCWTALSVFYVFQDKMPQDPLAILPPDSLFARVARAANDPWTLYISPEYSDVYNGNLSSENESGIGIFIGRAGDTCYIRFVIAPSPAHSAGLRKQDTLLSINGQTLVGISDLHVYERLLGPAGSRATLSVKRGAAILDIPVIRGSYYVPTVMTDTLDASVAYIWLNMFLDNTTLPGGTSQELAAALAETDSFPIRVLDLRGNPGGLIPQCMEVTGMFIDYGDSIALGCIRLPVGNSGRTQDTLFRAGVMIHNARTAKFVVLVDSTSASAAELLATALQTNRPDIPVLGCNTFGKARGQVMIPTLSNGIAKITYLTMKTAQGLDYNEVGLAPDSLLAPGTDWLDAAYRRAHVMIGTPLPKTPAFALARGRAVELNRKLMGIRRIEPLPVVRF